jgi:hypothetical protein
MRFDNSLKSEADLGLLPELERRGVELLAVYSEGDLGLELLMTHVRKIENLESLKRFQLEIFRETDHILTPLWTQQRIEALVLDWVARRLSVHHGASDQAVPVTSRPHEIVG